MPEVTKSKRLWFLLAMLIGLTLAVYFVWRPEEPIDSYAELPPSFTGESTKLKQTVFLPTLDTPIPNSQSVVWCSSIQLAWNRLKEDYVKEPIKLKGVQEIADRLNNAKQSQKDISPQDFIAMAGLLKEGIVERFNSELSKKFPDSGLSIPTIVDDPRAIISVGYIQANVKFSVMFPMSAERLSFKGSDGKNIPVQAFGIPEEKKNDSKMYGSRGQVEVLFRDNAHFALDLCRTSETNQIILAKIPRKSTLTETIADLEARIKKSSKKESLSEGCTLLVPPMCWRVDHSFPELKDKLFENQRMASQDYYLRESLQLIDFRLDRAGASLKSKARIDSSILNGDDHSEDVNPLHFHFDMPFLILMKKRCAEHPFFAMWVDNAELLIK